MRIPEPGAPLERLQEARLGEETYTNMRIPEPGAPLERLQEARHGEMHCITNQILGRLAGLSNGRSEMILIHIASDQQIAAIRHAAHAGVGCTWNVRTV